MIVPIRGRMAGSPVHQNDERGTRMGRHMTYQTADEFEAAVENYFASICRHETAREADIWLHGEWVKGDPILSDDGEPLTYEVYVYPPSLVDLQYRLGISRQTWSKYRERAKYRDIIEYADMRIHAYKMRLLDDPENKNSRGLIFDLENNHGMRERKEETVNMTSADISDTLTPEQKLEALRKLELIREDGDPP